MSKRRSFSVEYKKEIIKLITEQGKKASLVSKDRCANYLILNGAPIMLG